MSALKTVGLIVAAGISMQTGAADFGFDRHMVQEYVPGITPVGKLAWEQALPSASYQESNNALGEKVKTTRLNADMLLRTGLAQDLELQLGWQGHAWSKSKTEGQSR